jgi:hypothetical protein
MEEIRVAIGALSIKIQAKKNPGEPGFFQNA